MTKIGESLGVPSNLRAIDESVRREEAQREHVGRDYDSYKSRQKQIAAYCGNEGHTSNEIADEFGYSSRASAQYMIAKLIKTRKIYRGPHYKYYQIIKEPIKSVLEPQQQPQQAEVAAGGGAAVPTETASSSNEDKFVYMVEEMAKDFTWRAEGVNIGTIKRFVEYIKSNRETK